MVQVLAFFDTRYQSGPAGSDDPWRKLRETRPVSRLHFSLDQPSTLGMYDLGDPQKVADIVRFARNAGVNGFIVDLRAAGDRYVTGAEPLAPQTGAEFGLAFQWKNGADVFWSQSAPRETRAAHAAAMIQALNVGTPALLGGKVLLIVEKPKDLADPNEALALLREAAQAVGLPGLALAAARAEDSDGTYSRQGYDLLVDPSPADWHSCPPSNKTSGLDLLEVVAGLKDSVELMDKFFPYALFAVARMVNREKRGKVLPRVFPAYFDWSQNLEGGAIHLLNRRGGNNAPNDNHLFGMFLENAVLWARGHLPEGEQFVLLDSWNGWLTGTQVEPSVLDGDLVYNALRAGLDRARYVLRTREGAPSGGLDQATKERIELLCEAAKNF